MKIRIEYLYNKMNDITRIFVWRGMRLLEELVFNYEIDAYELEGIQEEIRKKYD